MDRGIRITEEQTDLTNFSYPCTPLRQKGKCQRKGAYGRFYGPILCMILGFSKSTDRRSLLSGLSYDPKLKHVVIDLVSW